MHVIRSVAARFNVGVVALACAGCAARPATALRPAILFIGDSFTYAQGGLDTHVTKIVASATPPIVLTTGRAVEGGAYLKVLWEMRSPVEAIDSGRFDTVVLQDDVPETNPDYFREYATKFVNEVRAHHARPVLLMAWAYERLSWISMEQIAKLHRELGKALNVDVAPVDPDGFAYAPDGVSPEERNFLQRIAWATVRDNTSSP